MSTLAVKIIGLAFKIPMLALLGAQGMGYFNAAYEIYALLCVIGAAGLPVALSMLVSNARARGDAVLIERVYKTAYRLFFAFGSVGSLVMLAFSKQIAQMIGNPASALSIAAIAPALFFICLASAVRGYCQGFGDMLPTAISQLIEAALKLLLGVLFAVLAKQKGLATPYVSACAVLGITVGSFFSFFYLAFARKREEKSGNDENDEKFEVATQDERGILQRLLRIALPITLGSTVLSLTRIIDMTLIMHRLPDIGVSVFDANKIYGAYTTLAVPMFALIPSLIAPVSMALVPQLSAHLAKRDRVGERSTVEISVRMTVIFALPASLGLCTFARPILEILFAGQNEEIDAVAPLLSLLGVSVLFSCLITTTNAILQSYRRTVLPIVSMSIGVLVKLAVSYILIGAPAVGVLGAPIGTFFSTATVTLINLIFMQRAGNAKIKPIKTFFLPLISSVAAIGLSYFAYVYLSGFSGRYISFAAAIFAAVAIYFVLMWLVGGIDKADIEMMPMMGKIKKRIKNKGQ